MKNLAFYSKAVAAAVSSLAGAIGVAAADGAITSAEWVGIASTVLVATFAVFAAPKNAVADGEI
jgi:hypothetical protein